MKVKQQLQFYDSNEKSTLDRHKVNFQIASSFEPRFFQEAFLSPYNNLLLIVFKITSKKTTKLFKYQYGVSKEIKNETDGENSKRHIEIYKCIFMKTQDEFILVINNGLKICRIINNKKWETISIINIQDFYRASELTKDEQTLYVSGGSLRIFERAQSQKQNQIWQIKKIIELQQLSMLTLFCLSDSQKMAALIIQEVVYIFRRKPNSHISNCSQFQLKYDTGIKQILCITEDGFIFAGNWIIQWNQWAMKIVRQFRSKIGNTEIYLFNYDKQSGLIALSKDQQLCVCRFKNGQFIVEQTLAEFRVAGFISQNLNLMIGLNQSQLNFYENKPQ